jgi:hypothetical protein
MITNSHDYIHGDDMELRLDKTEKKIEKFSMRVYHDAIILHRLLERYIHAANNKKHQDTIVKHIEKLIQGEYKVERHLDKKLKELLSKLQTESRSELHKHIEYIDQIRNNMAHYLAMGGELSEVAESIATGDADIQKIGREIDYIIQLDQALYHEIECIRHKVDAAFLNEIPNKYIVKTLFAYVPEFCVREINGQPPRGCVPSGDAEPIVIGWDPRMAVNEESLRSMMDMYSKPKNGISRVLVKFEGNTLGKFKRRLEAGPLIFIAKEVIPVKEVKIADEVEVWELFSKYHNDEEFIHDILEPKWREFRASREKQRTA